MVKKCKQLKGFHKYTPAHIYKQLHAKKFYMFHFLMYGKNGKLRHYDQKGKSIYNGCDLDLGTEVDAY